MKQNQKEKKNNLLVLSFPYSSTYGGGEEHTIQLIDALSPEHVFAVTNCSVLTPLFKKRGVRVENPWMPKEPVTLFHALSLFILFPVALLSLLRAFFRARQFFSIDTLYCLSLTEKLLFTPIARLFGIRVIWMEHAPIGRWLRLNPWRPFYFFFSFFATIITVSDSVAQQLFDIGISKKRVVVIPNGIEKRFFDAEKKMLGQTPWRIAYIGRLSFEKGIFDLLDAYETLILSGAKVQLRIVGDGPQKAELQEEIVKRKLSDSITCVGFVEDIIPELLDAHIVVMPSHRESFGLVAGQAIAAKTPVIGTRVGELPAIIGDESWIIDTHAPDQIVEKLQMMMEQYDSVIEEIGHQSEVIKEKYGYDEMISRYKRVFFE